MMIPLETVCGEKVSGVENHWAEHEIITLPL
jgi:hypothetical protein